ncbi:hypothetical protein C1E23_09595 [Pseudoalteromonas phenolica]|uniref:PAS domain-containing protein n=1 Tax=Pseudoalteromonas phenolica TaxID=161398 RepID=A0A4Q7INH1_9GAMM|nr:PAS domain-containing protein [Pseudoalteromonas phenolica]RZQ53322.1 hypothetical protein C1E23_09595 [Pseudoalteromonas phenolica]
MRNNQPITANQKTFSSNIKLISVTDLHGNITECNEHFVQVSGFSREELIGQPHNLVRHPDMPELAFRTMWTELKQGKPWMGIVKNRCKNGDFYWVNAYVTPVTENGKVVGYESVRSVPNADAVKRAEAIYNAVNNNNTNKLNLNLDPYYLMLGALLLLASVAFFSGYQVPAFIATILATLISLVLKSRQKKPLF